MRLLVAGPGDVDDIRDELPADLVERVTFLGLVDDQTKVCALHSTDVYVAPNTGGVFGFALLEVMASGTPVLASDLIAFRRVIDDGRAGALFANEDPADLARVASALLSDPRLRADLAAAGRDRAAEFDWGRVAREVLEVYDSVTVGTKPVQCDLRGQLVGRLARYTRVPEIKGARGSRGARERPT